MVITVSRLGKMLKRQLKIHKNSTHQPQQTNKKELTVNNNYLLVARDKS